MITKEITCVAFDYSLKRSGFKLWFPHKNIFLMIKICLQKPLLLFDNKIMLISVKLNLIIGEDQP